MGDFEDLRKVVGAATPGEWVFSDDIGDMANVTSYAFDHAGDCERI